MTSGVPSGDTSGEFSVPPNQRRRRRSEFSTIPDVNTSLRRSRASVGALAAPNFGQRKEFIDHHELSSNLLELNFPNWMRQAAETEGDGGGERDGDGDGGGDGDDEREEIGDGGGEEGKDTGKGLGGNRDPRPSSRSDNGGAAGFESTPVSRTCDIM